MKPIDTRVKIINFPKIEDSRGNLTFMENGEHLPFDIKRTYWIYDVPGGQIRGGHAFKDQKEIIIALSGSLDVVVNDGEKEVKHHLNRSYYGLYVDKGLWRHMENFSTNSLVLVLSSTEYSEEDYIRDFEIFKKYCDEQQ